MATRASGYRRERFERYYTPGWVTAALIDGYPLLRHFRGPAFDPCAGAGHICAALERLGWWAVAGSDIAPSPDPAVWAAPIEARDARQAVNPFPQARRVAAVTNPPYGHQGRLAMAIIARLIEQTAPRGLVAALLPIAWERPWSRNGLFDAEAGAPYAARVVLTDRIRWENLPQKPNGPSADHAWFVWDWLPPAQIGNFRRGQARAEALLARRAGLTAATTTTRELAGAAGKEG